MWSARIPRRAPAGHQGTQWKFVRNRYGSGRVAPVFFSLVIIAAQSLLVHSSSSAATEPAGCGRASAKMLAQLLGGQAEAIESRNPDEILSLREVRDILARAGVRVTGRRLTLSEAEALGCPMIAVVAPRHAVVLDCVTNGYVRVMENGSPTLMRRGDFEKEFAGVALVPDMRIAPPLETAAIMSLGNLTPGQSVVWSVSFENTSNEMLRVEPLSPVGGCRACGGPQLEQAFDLAPGERRITEVKLTAPREGVLEEHLPVRLPGGRVVITSCIGEVNAGFVVSPPILDLGFVSPGDESPTRVTIRRAAGLVPEVQDVKPSVPWLTPTQQRVKDTSLVMTMRLSPDSPIGAFKEVVTVNLQGGSVVHIPVEGEILSLLYTLPTVAVFGRIPLHSDAEWLGEIRGALCSRCDPGIAHAPPEISGGVTKSPHGYRVRLVFAPRRTGLFSDTVTIRTGTKEQETIALRVLAFVDDED